MRHDILCKLVVALALAGAMGAREARGQAGAGAMSEAEALKIRWPSVAGPMGTFAAARVATPLVGDLSQATKIWESECADLGRAKGSSQAYRRVEQFTAEGFAKMKSHPGSWSGLVVADGMVFGASWRPTGEWVDVGGNKVRLDAEDFVVAIDAKTGKTKWQAFEPGGILKGGGKRQGFQVGPVYHKGVVYSLTSTAKLLAYDAATGKKKWESDVHPARPAQKKAREDALAGLKEGKFTYALTPNWCASLAVVGNVLIVPDQAGGLVGVDLTTGGKKWAMGGVTSRWATPAAWNDGSKAYVLAANEKGELRLIDPAAGKEMWNLNGLGPNWPTLSPGKTHVLVNVVADSGKVKDKPRIPGRYGAIRLSAQKGEKAWEAPADHVFPVWMDTGARTRVVYQDGKFLLPQWNSETAEAEDEAAAPAVPAAPPGAKKTSTPVYILDEGTGKVLCRFIGPLDRDEQISGIVYWCGDRLVARGDSYHGPTHGGRHPWSHWSVSADNQITALPGKMDLGEFSNGYEVSMEVPLVGGLMFERTEKGTVNCYDLRAK